MTIVSSQQNTSRILAYAHIGDLHLTNAKERNFRDLLCIVAQIEMDCAHMLDFVFLPGDNADNGLPAQYKLMKTALKMLTCPVHIIPGDHDREPGNLDIFYKTFSADALPRAITVKGMRCIFLDIVGPGSGGPDFRMGNAQMLWLEHELQAAQKRNEPCVLFMHTYPDDLKGEGETQKLNRLIDSHDVALVDMGHTHYNEIANDGATVFAATRSTGQIEEGPPGYSLITLDNGIVSWRFKALDDAFPFVIITSPADHRLLRASNKRIDDAVKVRAKVFGQRKIEKVVCCLENGEWKDMEFVSQANIWQVDMALPSEPLIAITVQATDEKGRLGQHTIRMATSAYTLNKRTRAGSDAASIGAWLENGISGMQIGPNQNGKHD